MRTTWSWMLSLVAVLGCAAEAQPPGRPQFTASSDSFVARRWWSGNVTLWGGVAPTGAFVTVPDPGSGDLAVMTLQTGELRRLTQVPTPWADQWVENSVVSHDGRQVAYAWGDARGDFAWELRVIGIDGKGERTLLRLPRGQYIYPVGWAARDSAIVIQLHESDTTRIAMVSPSGSIRDVVKLGHRYSQGAVSADGRYLAYSYPEREGSPREDVATLDLATGARAEVLASSANEQVLGWIDAETLLISSDAPGAPAMLSIAVRDGRPVGEPALVRNDVWGMTPFGSFTDGIVYGVTTETMRLHVLQLDRATGGPLGAPQTVTERRDQPTLAAAWSPDGGRIAYFSRPHVRVRSLEAGEERNLSPVFSYVGTVRWAPDGRRLFLTGSRSGELATYELDLERGTARRIGATGVVTFDGKRLLRLKATTGGRARSLVEQDLATGQERVIAARLPDGAASLSLHPDGGRATFVTNPGAPTERARLHLVDLSNGTTRELTALPDGLSIDYRSNPAWSPDGRRVLFVAYPAGASGQGERILYATTAEGGAPVELMRLPNLLFVQYHPAGDRILFSAGEERTELWTLRRLANER